MHSKYVGPLCSRIIIFLSLFFRCSLHSSYLLLLCLLFYHHWPSFTLSLICMSSVRHPSKPTTASLPFAFFHVLCLNFSFYRKLISSQNSMRENLAPVFLFFFGDPSMRSPLFGFLWAPHPFICSHKRSHCSAFQRVLFLLTSVSCSYSPTVSPFSRNGKRVIGFVCTRCAGFEGAQMVVIGVLLWDSVEGRHFGVL